MTFLHANYNNILQNVCAWFQKKQVPHAPRVRRAHTYNFPLTDSSSPLTSVVIGSLTENQSKKPAVLQALLKYRNLGVFVGGTGRQMCLKSCTACWSVMVDGFSGIQGLALRSDVKKQQWKTRNAFIRHEWAAAGSDHVWSRWVQTYIVKQDHNTPVFAEAASSVNK